MDDTKYVIVCDMFAGERAVLLDSGITHEILSDCRPLHAGFCAFSNEQRGDSGKPSGRILVAAYGHSTSLDVGSRGREDAELICKALNPPGCDYPIFIPQDE